MYIKLIYTISVIFSKKMPNNLENILNKIINESYFNK